MAVAAGKKLNIVVRTVVTLFEARAESGGATGADVSEHFALGSGEHASPAGEEFLCVLTKDIGHFQPMFSHDWGRYLRCYRWADGERIERVANRLQSLARYM